ncbi:hypothetical protein BDP27DRAFT_1364557 [Rhodocollybia butyracea]|uniref:Uncharacterized protein n=1 Tax=Rhodocollybia butyracea TaxID=206335 RepID=A0A9P5U7G2_9AGAR|nr:hypothetical protein BDP27DRAFT_1364557 [Rhodocollybia butyracea]
MHSILFATLLATITAGLAAVTPELSARQGGSSGGGAPFDDSIESLSNTFAGVACAVYVNDDCTGDSLIVANLAQFDNLGVSNPSLNNALSSFQSQLSREAGPSRRKGTLALSASPDDFMAEASIIKQQALISSKFTKHFLYGTKIAKLDKGNWPSSDDTASYTREYYVNKKPVQEVFQGGLTGEEEQELYGNLSLDFIRQHCILMGSDQPLTSICDLQPSDKSSWREIFIVFKEKAVRRSMPVIEEESPTALQYSREEIARMARDRQPTSAGAKVESLVDTQVMGRADVIYNHRPLSLSPPPIVIYHPVFSKFLNIVNDQTLIFTHEELDHALNFLATSTEHYSVKQDRHINLKGIQAAVHEHILTTIVHRLDKGTAKPDGSISFRCPLLGVNAVSELTELKNDFGEGNSDPIAKAECAYVAIVSCTLYTPVREATCCPAFLVGIDGPNLTVSGAVFADSFMSERFISYEFIGPRPNVAGRSRLEEGVLRVAQIFRALRVCLNDLHLFYTALSPTPRPSPRTSSSPQNSAPHSMSLSIPRQPSSRVIGPAFMSFIAEGLKYSVEYLHRIVPDYSDKAVFRARITANNQSQDSIIKFTHKYCTTAHRILEALEPPKAPKLFFSDVVPELGLHIVVMGYVPPGRKNLEKADIKGIRLAVTTLHQHKLVLGDLHQPNVLLLPGGGVNLIDFYWCVFLESFQNCQMAFQLSILRDWRSIRLSVIEYLGDY